MQLSKILSAVFVSAALGLGASAALAHNHGEEATRHDDPASTARGTEGRPGVGGSISVPTAGDGPEQTSPYVDDQEDDGETTMQDITSGDRPITDESGNRSE